MRAHLTARRAPKVVTLLAAVVLLLAACGSSQASTTSGGTFTGAWVGPCCVGIANANPLIAGGDQSFLQLIYEPLVQYSVDKKTGGYGAPTPALAKSWSTSSNGLTWTFDLQPNVTWQDGSPFTAQDVIFTLTLCEDPQVACVYGGGIGDIKGAAEMKAGKATTLSGVSAPNPHTVTITTVSPNAALLDALSVIWIVQKKSLSGIPHAQIDKSSYWTTPGEAVGTGPFKLAQFKAGQFETLDRYNGYWRGKPELDKVVRQEFTDPSTALLAFDRGDLDQTYLTADEVKREEGNKNARIVAGPSQVDNVVVFNPLANPAFGNKDFKQAMMYAIDRASIIKNLYGGGGELRSCLFGNSQYIASSTPAYAYDPTKAKQLIQESGVDMATLPTFTFDTYYDDPLSLNVMTAIQKDWANVGLNVKIDQMEPAAWTNQYYAEGKSQVSFIGAQNGPDGNIAANYFASTASYESGAGDNGWKGYYYDNPEVDSLINQGRSTFVPEQRAAAYQQLCTVLATDLPWNFLWQTTRYWIVNKNVKNFVLTPAAGGGSYYDAAQTWSISKS